MTELVRNMCCAIPAIENASSKKSVVIESLVKSGFFPFFEKVGPESVTKYPAGARTEPKPVVTGHKVGIPTHDRL